MVQSQPGQIVRKTLSQKNKTKQKKTQNKRAGRVAQGESPVLKPHYHKKQSTI
jgi:hypothetical protein